MRSKRSKTYSVQSDRHHEDERAANFDQIDLAESHAAVPVQYKVKDGAQELQQDATQHSGSGQTRYPLESANTSTSSKGIGSATTKATAQEMKFDTNPQRLQPAAQYKYQVAERYAAVPIQRQHQNSSLAAETNRQRSTPTIQRKSNGVTQYKTSGQSNLEKIASKQSIHELAAHDIAYKSDFSAISVETLIQLRNAGYGSSPEDITFHFGKLGFQAVVIHSVTKGKPSILAIRGTTPGLSRNALETIYSDLDPRAVGAKQFEQNAVLINSLLQLGGAPMIVTGHSLGGAMAQHVAVNFSDMITEVTTFQSPGIDQSSVDKFNKMKNKPKVTHHIVTGDAVDKAGDANLEGDVYEHDFGLQLNLMELSSTLKSSEATIMLHLRAAAQAALVLDSMTKRRELSAAKAEIETLVKFLTVTVTNIGTSHGKMIFEEYRKNASKKPTQEQEITHQVGHFRSHPHQNERAVAEDIRDVVGTKIEKHIERYFVLLDSYDKIKSTATNLKDELKSSYEQSKNAILKKVESFF